jgi:hypothetical protein
MSSPPSEKPEPPDTIPSAPTSTIPASLAVMPEVPTLHPVYLALCKWQDARPGGVREFQVSRTSGYYICYLQDDYLLYVSDLSLSRETAIAQALLMAEGGAF